MGGPAPASHAKASTRLRAARWGRYVDSLWLSRGLADRRWRPIARPEQLAVGCGAQWVFVKASLRLMSIWVAIGIGLQASLDGPASVLCGLYACARVRI